MGRLVQQPTPAWLSWDDDPSGVRASPLRGPQPRAATRIGAAENLGRLTFTAIAAATGISRTSLYREPDIRAVIDEHRHRGAHNAPLAGITDEIATLRTVVEELAARVRSHEEQLRRLS